MTQLCINHRTGTVQHNTVTAKNTENYFKTYKTYTYEMSREL